MAMIRRIIDEPFIPVEARNLILDARFPFDVFVEHENGHKLLFSKGTLFTIIERQMLISKGIGSVFARSHEKLAIEGYLSKEKDTSRKSFYDDPLAFRKFVDLKEQFYHIDKFSLVPGSSINFSISLLDGVNVKPFLDASLNSPVVIDENMLKIEGDAVIRKVDIPLFKSYMRSLSNSSESSKLIFMKENAKVAIKELLENPADQEKTGEILEEVEGIISLIFKNSDSMQPLLSLQNRDYYVYTHSVNVAVLSIGLGAALGLGRGPLEQLGIGAILHDVGMSVVSSEIADKQGRLTHQEYSILKMHVLEGEKILRTNREIPEESLVAVLQHHEKLSGKGYPFRLSGNSIKLFGRIAGIADCYDSLITRRPYRPAFSPFTALSMIAKETGSYDPELLKIFIRMLGKVKS